MIKAGIKGKRPFILLGLTEGNIIRLKNGQPIKVSIESCGIPIPGDVGIIYGPTEADIEGQMRQAGLVSKKTDFIYDKQALQEQALTAEYDKILVATVGLPRSGKSTWAKSQAWPIVCPDSVRLAIHGERFIGLAEPFVWATVKAMIRALFLAGHKIVILDACNYKRKYRDEFYSSDWQIFFKEIDTPKEVCLQRAMQENDERVIPYIERYAEHFEPLEETEARWPEPSGVIKSN